MLDQAKVCPSLTYSTFLFVSPAAPNPRLSEYFEPILVSLDCVLINSSTRLNPIYQIVSPKL